MQKKKKKEEGKGSDQAMKKGKEIGNSESKIPVEKKKRGLLRLIRREYSFKVAPIFLAKRVYKKKKAATAIQLLSRFDLCVRNSLYNVKSWKI